MKVAWVTVPTCSHKGLDAMVNLDFEVGVTSSRADFGSLIEEANKATGRQDWSSYVY